MNTQSKTIRSIIGPGLLLALLVAACGKTSQAPEAVPSLRLVRVATVQEGPAEPAIVASGVAASRDEAKLAFKIGGVIADISVREGDTVKRGQRLATIEIAEIDAQLTQAREAARKATRDLDRGRTLFEQDVVTREQLDDLTTADAVARAGLDATSYNRRYAEITAPADGRVLSRLAEPRELIQAGAPVLVLSRSGSGTVLQVGLADRDAVRVQAGDVAEVRFDALPDKRFEARVQEVSRASDPRSGTYRVELAVTSDDDPQNNAIVSGLIGRARILPSLGAQGKRSRVPIEALVEGDQQKARVYLFDPATKAVRGIELVVAFIDDRDAVLVDPLPSGTQVVTDGAAYLREGEMVRLAEPAP